MSFDVLYQKNRDISPAVRGLARLIDGGTWIHWTGDGAWRKLTPPMDEWETFTEGPLAGIRGLREGRTLQFSRHDRDVSWPIQMYGECHPLTAAEKEHLYAIYERVYLIPEREMLAERRKVDAEQAQRTQRAWHQELEQIGRAAA